jgi:hypothetical protein
MAEGLRVRHRTITATGRYVVIDQRRPVPPSEPCADCARLGLDPVHRFKTYHLDLNGGHAIVSTTVWERIQGLNHGLELVNTVAQPPPITIGIGSGVLIDGKPTDPTLLGASTQGEQDG